MGIIVNFAWQGSYVHEHEEKNRKWNILKINLIHKLKENSIESYEAHLNKNLSNKQLQEIEFKNLSTDSTFSTCLISSIKKLEFSILLGRGKKNTTQKIVHLYRLDSPLSSIFQGKKSAFEIGKKYVIAFLHNDNRLKIKIRKNLASSGKPPAFSIDDRILKVLTNNLDNHQSSDKPTLTHSCIKDITANSDKPIKKLKLSEEYMEFIFKELHIILQEKMSLKKRIREIVIFFLEIPLSVVATRQSCHDLGQVVFEYFKNKKNYDEQKAIEILITISNLLVAENFDKWVTGLENTNRWIRGAYIREAWQGLGSDNFHFPQIDYS